MKRKKIARFVLLLFSPVLVFGLYVLGNLIFASLTDFKPEEKIILTQKGINQTDFDTTIKIVNWNIGYSGLGKDADFFYDGGEMTRSPKEKVHEYFSGIKRICTEHGHCDFILLQEVDMNSKRSYYMNQYDSLQALLYDFNSTSAINYNCRFVPVPYLKPLGKTYSGLVSFSKHQSVENTRYQFPGEFPFPKRLYLLDRCMLVSRYSLKNGKELIIINSHFSAYDDSGLLKKQEMDYFKKYVLAEYEKGNYIVCGADWNQCPPGFDVYTFSKKPEHTATEKNIDVDFLPSGWQWAFDKSTPTNRSNDAVFDVSKTFTTIIDFYLLSPNVALKKIETLQTDFTYSDHQPVYIEVMLKQ